MKKNKIRPMKLKDDWLAASKLMCSIFHRRYKKNINKQIIISRQKQMIGAPIGHSWNKETKVRKIILFDNLFINA